MNDPDPFINEIYGVPTLAQMLKLALDDNQRLKDKRMNMIKCDMCGRCYAVSWLNDGLGPPEYCPMCGCDVDVSDWQESVEEEVGDG